MSSPDFLDVSKHFNLLYNAITYNNWTFSLSTAAAAAYGYISWLELTYMPVVRKSASDYEKLFTNFAVQKGKESLSPGEVYELGQALLAGEAAFFQEIAIAIIKPLALTALKTGLKFALRNYLLGRWLEEENIHHPAAVPEEVDARRVICANVAAYIDGIFTYIDLAFDFTVAAIRLHSLYGAVAGLAAAGVGINLLWFVAAAFSAHLFLNGALAYMRNEFNKRESGASVDLKGRIEQDQNYQHQISTPGAAHREVDFLRGLLFELSESTLVATFAGLGGKKVGDIVGNSIKFATLNWTMSGISKQPSIYFEVSKVAKEVNQIAATMWAIAMLCTTGPSMYESFARICEFLESISSTRGGSSPELPSQNARERR